MIDSRAYLLQQPNIADTVFQGFNQGVQLTAYRDAREAAKLKAEQEALAKEQMQKDLSEVAANPSYEGYTRLQTLYPQLSEQMGRARDTMTEGQQRQATSTAMQSTMLLGAGDTEGAKKLIESKALAYENSGDVNTANAYRAMAKGIDLNPNAAKEQLMMIAANGLKPEELPKFFGDLGAERRAEQLQPYEVAQAGANIAKTRADTGLTQQQALTERQNTIIKEAEADTAADYFSLRNEEKGAQIDKIKSDQRLSWARLELDEDKLDADLEWRYEELDRKGTQLNDAGKKQVNDAVLESTALATMAQQQRELANKARNSGQAGGLISAGWEGLKNSLGIETERGDMVREVTKMINSEVIKNLPPGPATDKDVDIIRKGFPPATADGKTIARFLDTMARVNMAGAANKQMQAEWQAQNGSLGNSKGDLDVMGIRVPKGMTYQKFASANMGKAIKYLDRMGSQQAINQGTASYLKYGQ